MVQQLLGYNSLQYLWRDRQTGNRTVRPSIWRVQIWFLETWRDVSFFEYIRNRLVGQRPVKQFLQEGNYIVGDSLKLSSWQRVERATLVRLCTNYSRHFLGAHLLELTKRHVRYQPVRRWWRVSCLRSTPATSSSKSRWNWLALMSLTDGARPRPSSVSIERHNWRGVDFSASILSLQNCSRLLRSSARYSRRYSWIIPRAKSSFEWICLLTLGLIQLLLRVNENANTLF